MNIYQATSKNHKSLAVLIAADNHEQATELLERFADLEDPTFMDNIDEILNKDEEEGVNFNDATLILLSDFPFHIDYPGIISMNKDLLDDADIDKDSLN